MNKFDPFKKLNSTTLGILTVVGGFFINVGMANEANLSFYSVYYASYLKLYHPEITLANIEALNTIWYVSQLFLLYATPYFLDKLGARLCIMIFGFTIPVVTFITSLLTNIYLIYLIFGVIYGLCFGALFMLATNVAWSYFPAAPGTCAGFITMGFTISPLLFGNLSLYMVNPNNLSATIMEMNGNTPYYYYDESVASNVPRMFRIMALFQLAFFIIGTVVVQKKLVYTQEQLAEMVEKKHHDENLNHNELHEAEEEAPLVGNPLESNLTLKELFQTLLSKHMIANLICSLTAFQFQIFLLYNFKSYGLSIFNDDKFIDFVGDFAMIFAAIGRVCEGVFFDLTPPKLTYNVLLIVSTIATLLMNIICQSKAGFAIMIVLAFYLYGMHVGYYPAICGWTYGPNHGTHSFAIIYTAISIATFFAGSGSYIIINLLGYAWIFQGYFFVLHIISLVVYYYYEPKQYHSL